MLRTFIVFLVSYIFLSSVSLSQDKLLDLGFGVETSKKKNVFSFYLSFNRIPGTNSKSGTYLCSKQNILFTNDLLSIKPSMETSFGNVESSPNNVLVEIGLEYYKKLAKTSGFYLELSPAFCSNKNLDTSIFYGDIGIKYLKYNHPSKIAYYILPSFNFHIGKRIQSEGSGQFYRFEPRLILSINFFNDIMVLYTDSKISFISKEPDIADGSYHLFNAALDIALKKKLLALSIKYTNGYDQPSYKKISAITLGFSIYK